MSFGEAIAPFLGRLLLAWFFLSEAWRYAGDWTGTTTLLAMKDIPAPGVLLFIALAAMIMGGLSLLFGWKTRLGALILFAFTIVSTIAMHDYWTIDDAGARQEDYDIFARNLAVAGGLLVLVGLGGGKFALDNVRSPGSRR
jgi:putative oxidoreductase